MRGLAIIIGGLGLALSVAPAVAQDTGDTQPQAYQGGGSGDVSTRQRYVQPYIELGQVVTADLTNDDVLTYSEVGAGIDAGIATRNSQAQVSARYEHDFAWGKHRGNNDYLDGLARAAVAVAPGLSVEGGALATRERVDIRGAAPNGYSANTDNLTQVYAVYAGPTLGTHVGPVGVSASYRYGYTKVESPGYVDVGPNQPRLDNFDDANSHVVQGSLNLKSGDVLPVGLTFSGAWEQDNAHQLAQRYEGTYGRADMVVPVSRTFALEGGIGYEKIEISQKDPVLDANNRPVVDGSGRFVTDQSSPRRIAYRTDGIIYDAGVLWRPSPRTQLEAHVGRRYGGTSYAGAFSWAPRENIGAQVVVYDEVDTFARELRHGLEGLPTSFIAINDVLGGGYGGCVYGTSGSAAGGCLNRVFQSITSSSFRARGVDAIVYASHGPLRTGFGVGYANRHFYAPETDADFTVSGVNDDSYYAQFFAIQKLDYRSSVQGNLYLDYYKSGIPGAAGVFSTGATGTYNRSFGRIDAVASLGVYAYDSNDLQNDVSATGLVGMRYNF